MNAIDIYNLIDECGIEKGTMDKWSKQELLDLFYEIWWSLEDRFKDVEE